jgi:hypothetical protein
MAKSLAELKKQSASVLSKIKDNSQSKSSGSKSYTDERIWTPQYDKAKGAGYAKIRFLPAPQGEEFPFVTVYSHAFKGATGKWYIENSLSTIKKQDPVGQMNSALWNSGVESDKEVARKYKRKTSYYANILIVDDPIRPELNGTVKIFKYGPAFHKMLEEKMFPQFESDEPMNPFDPWTGALFEIRIKTIKLGEDMVPNYEKSFFHNQSELGDDDEIEAIWAKCHSLAEFVSDKNFKTYEELQRRLVEVLGHSVGSGIPVVAGDDPVREEKAAPKQKEKPAPKQQKPAEDDLPFEVDTKPSAKATSKPKADAADDDDLEFFKNL